MKISTRKLGDLFENHISLSHVNISIIITALLVGEFFVFGKYSPHIMADNGELAIGDLLSISYVPSLLSSWDPFSSGGVDRFANAYSGLINILLFYYLPGWFAYGLSIFVQTFLATIGTFGLCKRTFEFDDTTSFLVAILFVLGLTPYLPDSIYAFTPFGILTLSFCLADRSNKGKWAIAAIVLFVLSHTAFINGLPAGAAAVVVWFMFMDTRKKLSDWVIILGYAALIILLRFHTYYVVYLVSITGHFPYTRVEETFSDSLGIFKIFFFTSSPILLLGECLFLIGFFNKRHSVKRKTLVLFGLIFGAAIVPIATASVIFLSLFVPVFKGYSIHILGYVVRILIPFSAGFGLEMLIRKSRDSKSPAKWAAIGVCIVVASVITYSAAKKKWATIYNWVNHGSYVRNYESPFFKELADTLKASEWPGRVETFQIFPTFLHAYGIETAGGYKNIYQRGYYEFWGHMVAPFFLAADTKNIFEEKFFKNIREKTIGDMKFRGHRMRLYPSEFKPEWELGKLYNLNMLSLANVTHIVLRDRIIDPSFELIKGPKTPWSALPLLEKTKINLTENFSGRNYLYLYRNKEALPRFFTVENARIFQNGNSVLKALQQGAPAEFRKTVYLEQTGQIDRAFANTKFESRKIRLIKNSTDEIELELMGEKEGFLVVTIAFSPYWKSEIDGKKANIIPAYRAFMGVYLPPGSRKIVFRYDRSSSNRP